MSEASTLPSDGVVAIASVVINRMYSEYFPNTMHDVIWETGQFQPTFDGRLYSEAPSERVIGSVNDSMYHDNSNGSLYFANLVLAHQQGNSTNVNWMKNNLEETVKIKNTTFFK